MTGLAFSLGKGIIHPYYTVALAPAIGGVIGVGGALMWANRDRPLAVASSRPRWEQPRVAYVLLDRTPGWSPWLRPLVISPPRPRSSGSQMRATKPKFSSMM